MTRTALQLVEYGAGGAGLAAPPGAAGGCLAPPPPGVDERETLSAAAEGLLAWAWEAAASWSRLAYLLLVIALVIVRYVLRYARQRRRRARLVAAGATLPGAPELPAGRSPRSEARLFWLLFWQHKAPVPVACAVTVPGRPAVCGQVRRIH